VKKMDKIAVALALSVIMVGAALYMGGTVADRATDRGKDVASSLNTVAVNATTGVTTFTTP
jgi:hypothetical protein